MRYVKLSTKLGVLNLFVLAFFASFILSMGKLQNFVVVLGNQLGVYYAGQTLTGHIEVLLSESMNMRRIHLTLLGRAKVSWSEGSSKNRKHYRAEEVYFNDRTTVVGSDAGQITLPAGLHRFPFTVTLNANLPSSFEGQHGYVRYTATATIDKPWKFDHDTRIAFTVICILDLNRESFSLREPFSNELEQDVSCCCCTSGVVNAKVSVNKRVFVPGETILVTAVISNNSSGHIEKTWVSLKQHIEFQAQSDAFFSSGNFKSRTVSVVVATVNKDEHIPSGNTGNWRNVPLIIPACAPSRLVGCSIINVNYTLKFYSDNGLKVPVDLVIGTIPLRESLPVVTSQPSAPSMASSEIDISSIDMPPPSYEECVQGRVTLREDGDSEYVRGNKTWAPMYPIYRQLSNPAGSSS